jgi:hypothetical protein
MFFSWFSNETTDPKHKDKELCPATFFVLPALQKKQRTKTEQPKNQETKSKKKNWENKIAPPKGGG